MTGQTADGIPVFASDFIDGGRGHDTLTLFLTQAQQQAVQDDLDALVDFVQGPTNKNGRSFTASKLNLTIKN
ncbi:MAG: hypothetical protein AAFN08_07365, partial [Cyanobacteria bacterium J06559_3]